PLGSPRLPDMVEASPTPDAVLHALRSLRDPATGQDLVSQNAIRELRIEGGAVRFFLALSQTGTPAAAALKSDVERTLMQLPGVAEVHAKLVNAPPAQGLPPKRPIPGVRRVVAVSSGKGGVGKSTVCVNLAAALARSGRSVGILDGDIYGPNVPMMLGARGRPQGSADRIFPFVAHGMQVMSMGLLVPEDQPMIWRGPRLNQAVQQFMFQVEWHDLD